MRARFGSRVLGLTAALILVGCYQLDFSERDGGHDSGPDQPPGPDSPDAPSAPDEADAADDVPQADAANSIDAPSLIRGFTTSVPAVTAGKSALLTPSFASGSGEITPNIGQVTSDVVVSTGPLSETTTFTLTVTSESGARSISTITIEVAASASVIASDLMSVRAMTTDGQALYFAGSNDSIANPGISGVMALALADNSLRLLSTDQLDIAITTDGTNLYWTSYDYQSAQGRVTKLSLPDGQPSPLASGSYEPTAIATDGEFVYWAIANAGSDGGAASPSGTGSVMRVPVTGGDATVLAANREAVTALILAGETLYWSEYSTDNQGSLQSMPKPGGLAPVPVALGLPRLTAFAWAAGTFYWTDSIGLVAFRSPGPATTVVPTGGMMYGGSSPVVDDTAIYWLSGKSLMRTALDGGKTTTHAISQINNGGNNLIMDGENLYWVDAGGASGGWAIVKTPK